MANNPSQARVLALLCLLSLCLALAGCGNKGPLKLPDSAGSAHLE
ncbi:MAG: lipoprotein [Lysobacterales bacterium]